MPSADTKRIAAAAEPQQHTKSAILPSIEVLGRHLDAVECERTRLDTGKDPDRFAEAILWARAQALRSLIGTMRPVTLADAAVSAHVAGEAIADIRANEHTKDEVRSLANVAERLLFGIASVVATVADLKSGEMFAEDQRLADSRFGAVECVA